MRLQLGSEFNKEVKSAIIKKKFPRMDEGDVQVMIDDMIKKENATEQSGTTNRILGKIPSFMNKLNANSGGK